jgi:hypothetical protein
MKHTTAFGLFAVLFVAATPSLRAAEITYSQSPDPFLSFEGTTGNIGFITLKNTSADQIAFITSIRANQFNAIGGESDDEATNLALVGPNPTALKPVQIGPNGTANIKFSWDAVDRIKDNDVDFGDWGAIFSVHYLYVDGTDLLAVAQGNVRVADAPEPSAGSLLAMGIVLVLAGRYRFKSRAAG